MISFRASPAFLASFVVLALGGESHAGFTAGPGFQSAAVPATSPGGFVGGLDWLPNGHAAIFDGTAVVEVDPANGNVVGTVFTPPSFVFGAFVKVDPTGSFLLFGESSGGTITRVPLAGGSTTPAATVTFPYDCDFDPSGACYVSASPTFSDNRVYRVDLVTGALDLIAVIPGPSGPIAFDTAGNLYLGESSFVFPAPIGQQHVYQFTAAQVASAIGPTNLALADAAIFLPGQTSPLDLAFDEEGDLLVSDSVLGTLNEFDPAGTAKATLGGEAAFNAVTNLAFKGNRFTAKTWFEQWQPETGGTLLAVSTDYFSFNDLNVITPRRPELSTNPASPVPVGNFGFALEHGPSNGLAFLFVAGGTVAPEYNVYGVGVPFLFALDPTSFGPLIGPFQLDSNGEFHLATSNPGLSTMIATQGWVVDPNLGVVGTTSALTIVLQ